VFRLGRVRRQNDVVHPPGDQRRRAWSDDHSLVFEVSDRGHVTSRLADRLAPTLDGGSQGGLWLADQLCDLVQI
jgi:hypothetical protein